MKAWRKQKRHLLDHLLKQLSGAVAMVWLAFSLVACGSETVATDNRPEQDESAPRADTALPDDLVGDWAYSDSAGSWGYTFQHDGSYEHAFKTEQASERCTFRIERYEQGVAFVDGNKLTLQVTSGQKETRDSCDSKKNTVQDLAQTSEQLQWQADGDTLYINNIPFQQYTQ